MIVHHCSFSFSIIGVSAQAQKPIVINCFLPWMPGCYRPAKILALVPSRRVRQRCTCHRRHGGSCFASTFWCESPQKLKQPVNPFGLTLRVIICLEKLFYKILFLWFWYDFVMVLLWFPYGWFYVFFASPENSYDFDMVFLWSWSVSLFACEICYGWSYLFCKKIFCHFFGHFRMEKTINYLYLKKENLNQKQNML